MTTITMAEAPRKVESLQEVLLALLQDRGVTSENFELAQLADNLAYIYGEKYGHDLVVNHSKFYIVLSIADNTWRLTFLYEDTTLLSGQKKANLEDALDGLFMASAKKMAKHVPHGA